jgi:hypothetical protein
VLGVDDDVGDGDGDEDDNDKDNGVLRLLRDDE